MRAEEAFNNWCEGIQLQQPPRFTPPPPPTPPPPLPSSSSLLFSSLLFHPLHHITLTPPALERQLQKTLCRAVCVWERETARERWKEKTKKWKNKEWKERVWETERESIRHSGSRRHTELLPTYTYVFLQSPLKAICIWFENNPYVAPSTYVLQIYASWTKYACMWERGGWAPFVLVQKDGRFYAFEHLVKV